jgi:RNA polymerase sigma-70 factor (ECF subfamily)
MALDIPAAGLAEFLAEHARLIDRLHAKSGAARWEISREGFAEALYRSAAHRFAGQQPDANPLGAYLGALHLEDLALACALRQGSAAAWEDFVTRYRPVLYSAARAIVGVAGEARARELADSLYAELYGLQGAGGARGRPLLEYFHGRSKLATWLRTVLAQRHVDLLRAARATGSLDEIPAPRQPAARVEAADPDRARLLPRLRGAVAGALAALPAGDRLLLSLYYLQELTLAQIARLQGVSEATISRQLDRVRGELRQRVEHTLGTGLAAENGRAAQAGLSSAEVELCFAYAVEDWSFDLGAALTGGTATGRGES